VIKCITFPGRFVQGPGVIIEMGKYAAIYGKRALILGGPSGLKATEEPMTKSLTETNVEARHWTPQKQ